MTRVVGGMRGLWELPRPAPPLLRAREYVVGAVHTRVSAGSPRRDVQAAWVRAAAAPPALAAKPSGCGG